MVTVKVKKLSEEAIVPNYTLEFDAGLELYSMENFIIKAGERHGFSTKVAMEVPQGYVGLIWDRSGLSNKFGLKVLGGVIDSGYRGEIIVTLLNAGEDDYAIRKGDRIAQMLIQNIENAKIEIVKDLEKSERSERKFGSTGR
jgi:dUTP pyrophosphatase